MDLAADLTMDLHGYTDSSAHVVFIFPLPPVEIGDSAGGGEGLSC